MQTDIRRVDSSYCVLTITASKRDLEDDVKRAVRELKVQTRMNGFRPGRVPGELLKRLHAAELSATVSEKVIKEVYEDLVEASSEYAVVGAESIASLNYKVDGDLKAEVAFNVALQIDFDALREQVIRQRVRKVTPGHVEEYFRELLAEELELKPLQEGEKISGDDHVLCKIQEVDMATRIVLVGGESEEREVDLGLTDLDEMEQAIRDAVVGRSVGETVYFGDPREAEVDVVVKPESVAGFAAQIVEAKRLVLPLLDEELVAEMTGGTCTSEKEWRAEAVQAIQEAFDEHLQKENEFAIRVRMLELYPFRVPETEVNLLVDRFGVYREGVERALRWHLIRESVNRHVKDEDAVSVSDAEAEEENQEDSYTALSSRSPHLSSLFDEEANQRALEFLGGFFKYEAVA